MKTQILAAVSVLATALACGASLWSARPAESGGLTPADATRGDLVPAALAPVDDDPSQRVTPVVKAVRRAADSVVSIYTVDRRRGAADGQGSGVILDENGLVITNWHVVWRAAGGNELEGLQVRLRDARQFPARLLSASREHDLALLQLELPKGEKVQPIVLGDSSELMIGETLIAIGNPQGHANTVTVGVLSAEDRSINVRAPDGLVGRYSGLLQTDAAINQGNSGGALLDITGKLIGINNAMAVTAENIGFAIPVNTVRRVFEEVLLTSENLASVWLGLRVTDDAGAVVVSAVEPESPAARAGIRKGDRILSANDAAVHNGLEYARRIIADARAGEQFSLRLERAGRKLEAAPVPLSRAGYELAQRIGVEVETITFEQDPALVRAATRSFYGDRARRVRPLAGVTRVTQVHSDSPAEALDLRAGDILLGFRYRDYWDYRDIPFESESEIAEALRIHSGREMPIIVLRGGQELEGTLSVR